MTEEKQTWDKMEGETNRAYNAFLVYRGLGPLRSYSKAVKKFYGEDCDKPSSKLRQTQSWASKYKWVSRCADWDQDEEKLRVEAQRQAIFEMNDRHARAGKDLFTITVRDIYAHTGQEVKDKDGTQVKPKLSPEQDRRLLETATKLERLARGEVTEITKATVDTTAQVNITVQTERAKKLVEDILSGEKTE